MSSDCKSVWDQAADKDKARAIDAFSADCGCERCSLSSGGAGPVQDDEIVARILVSPTSFDAEKSEILRAKLVSIFSSGVSLIRENASDEEIEQTVWQQTTGAQQAGQLVAAAIMPASRIRLHGAPPRKFCVYDTDAPNKVHHADIVAPTPSGTSGEIEKAKKVARKALQEALSSNVVEVRTSSELISALRSAAAKGREGQQGSVSREVSRDATKADK